MDLHELISGGSEFIRKNRPDHPDIDRISDVVLEMKAEMAATANDFAKQQKAWEDRMRRSVDLDCLQYQAMQCAFDIMQIRTGADLIAIRKDRSRNLMLVGIMQAFFDGWAMSYEFQQRGGHRD